MIRKCAYTGLEAKLKDNVIPKENLKEELHNWCSGIPCSESYKAFKQGRDPTTSEMEAHHLFFKIEIAKMELKALENRQQKLQNKLKKDLVEYQKKLPKTKKKQLLEVEKAYKIKEIKEIDLDKVVNKAIEKVEKKGDSLWD